MTLGSVSTTNVDFFVRVMVAMRGVTKCVVSRSKLDGFHHLKGVFYSLLGQNRSAIRMDHSSDAEWLRWELNLVIDPLLLYAEYALLIGIRLSGRSAHVKIGCKPCAQKSQRDDAYRRG